LDASVVVRRFVVVRIGHKIKKLGS
jgi:hypothetical protein